MNRSLLPGGRTQESVRDQLATERLNQAFNRGSSRTVNYFKYAQSVPREILSQLEAGVKKFGHFPENNLFAGFVLGSLAYFDEKSSSFLLSLFFPRFFV